MAEDGNSLLDKVVCEYVKSTVPKEELHEYFGSQLKNTIKQSIIQSEKDRLDDYAQSMLQKSKRELEQKMIRERLMSKIAETKDLILVAVIVAFLVGLLTNQVTELIAQGKGVAGDYVTSGTVGVSCVLLCVIALAIKFIYVDKVESLMSKANGEDNAE